MPKQNGSVSITILNLEEVTGGRRQQQNKQHHDLYSSTSIIREIKSRLRLAKNVGKHAGKRPLGRPRHRWENNNEMYLKETGQEDVNFVHLG
jgi:ribosomal protein S19E (S16A)